MQLDGAKIQQIRMGKGLSQMALAGASGYDRRTIQRAEAGDAVRPNVAASLAQALDVSVDEIKSRQLDMLEGLHPKPGEGEVVLLPCRSGRRLVETLRANTFAKLEHTVEPRSDNIQPLRRFAELFEKVRTDPWLRHGERPNYSEHEILDLMSEANEILDQMAEKGFTLYLGTYMILHENLYYGEFGEVYSGDGEKVYFTKALLILSEDAEPFLNRSPVDHHLYDAIPF